LAGFLKKSVELLLFLIIALIFQVMFIPWLFPYLRVDIFLCFVISMCVFARFPHGLFAVIIMSVALQAFSCAKPGYLPFVYTLTYFLLDMLKGILFIDTIPAQIIFCFLFSLFIAASSKLFSHIIITDTGLLPILAGSVITAAICPFIVRRIGRILVKNEN